MKRQTVRQPEVKQTVPRVKDPDPTDRTGPVTRKAPEVGGGLIMDTIHAGDADDVIQTAPTDRTGVTGAGGTRLRSSGGGGIKLRGQ